MSTAITRVHEVLESFAARDRDGNPHGRAPFSGARSPVGGLPAWCMQTRLRYAAKAFTASTPSSRRGGSRPRRQNVVIVTPTASGKTLCYNLPV